MNTIYLACAIIGGVVMVLRVILMIVGIDHGDVPDAAPDGIPDHDVIAVQDGSGAGFQILSFQSIAGFLLMFGLVGMGLLRIQASEILSFFGALAAGAVTALGTALIFRGMSKLQSEGTLVIGNAVGQVGTVYLTIPESGTGVVNVTVQGAVRSLDAVSETHQRIPTGAVVKVVRVTGNKILVVREQDAGI